MNQPTHNIIAEDVERFEKLRAENALHRKYKTSHQPRTARLQKVGRNHKCPCGSGLKFKRCCGNDNW